MKPQSSTTVLLVMGALMLAACAAGDPRFTADTPAGFWLGMWHGFISLMAFIIGLFVDGVEIYERANNGAWYDLGYLLGMAMLWGGGGSTAHRRWWPRKKTAEEQEWEEIAKKVEAKLRRKIRQWAEAEPDEDWEVVGDKAQAKLKQRLRAWAEDEPKQDTRLSGPGPDA